MLMVQLVRRTFPERPDWILVDESIPLGTRYEVIGYDSEVLIKNLELREQMVISVFLVRRAGYEGFMPTCLFEKVEES